jgi:hypothetical protein
LWQGNFFLQLAAKKEKARQLFLQLAAKKEKARQLLFAACCKKKERAFQHALKLIKVKLILYCSIIFSQH